MSTDDQRLWIVFNGEIYNYLELRQNLIGEGYRFRSHSDTEVLLHLYEEEGPGCLDRLNGMFAFAIWDAQARTLFAARDRFGIKPFYYFYADDTFAFASEIKALLRVGTLKAEVDSRGLADYFTLQFCLGDKTLFRGIRKLMPGHALFLKPSGEVSIRKYWDLDFTVDTDHTEEYFQSRLVRLLEDAVRLRLRADVPVGAHLSGGLDSSTVVCQASSLLDHAVHTFSGGFREGPQYDEIPYARIVAETVNAMYHEVYPSAKELVEVLPKLVWHMDEPAAGPGIFPQFAVSQLASQHVKVVLGGQGGDEIFGGYTRYLIAYLEQCIHGGIAGTQQEGGKYVVTFESILPNLVQLQGYEPLIRHFWREGLFDPPDERYFRLIDRSSSVQDLVVPEVLKGDTRYSVFDAYKEIFGEGDIGSYINKMTRFDLKTLLPALLHVEDRTSMAVSLESRVPLLDHRIAELAASVPPMIKYKGGRAKYIFRQVVQHIVPPQIYQREDKMGFPVPLSEWYIQGPVRDFTHDILLGTSARDRGIYNTQKLELLLDSERAYGRGIWGLLNLELWMRTFVDGHA